MIAGRRCSLIASDFETIYPFISAYPGLFGGFVSGSEVSAITMP
jgi:L-lactate permease